MVKLLTAVVASFMSCTHRLHTGADSQRNGLYTQGKILVQYRQRLKQMASKISYTGTGVDLGGFSGHFDTPLQDSNGEQGRGAAGKP